MVLMLSLRSRSSHGQGCLNISHFEVKDILESNGNVFRYLSRSGQLAFVRMLIFLVILNVLCRWKSFEYDKMDRMLDEYGQKVQRPVRFDKLI